MGVEEIQKINNLAKELLKHKIADSSETAFAKAEQMVRGEAPKVTKEDEVNREIRQLGMILNSLRSEIFSVQQQFKALKDDLDLVKKKIASQPLAQPAPIVQHQVQHSQLVQQSELRGNDVPIIRTASAPPETEEKKGGEQARPRTGDFKEKDVQIEKFFYYGTKK